MNEQVIAHVLAVGANYWSIWNWHHIAAANVLSYYDKFPEAIDHVARRIGYRIYPAFIWSFERDGGAGRRDWSCERRGCRAAGRGPPDLER